MNISKLLRVIKRYSFIICCIGIIVLSILLRFYHYQDRWGLAYDQAHDALVARYALKTHKIPLLGPFSSAGPFQTGGQWYWFIMAATSLYPPSVLTPWIVLTLLYVFFVFCMIKFGTELVNKQFGLILGLFSAVSTGQIAQSVNLTNQSPLAFISLLSLWSGIRYIRSGKTKYIFALGLLTSTGMCIHLQGAALGIFVLIVLGIQGISKKLRFMDILALFLGGIIGVIPILVYDVQNNFVNIKNMLYYFLHDQYLVSLDVYGRRWLTYGGDFVPKLWAHVIGGNQIVSVGVVLLSSLVIVPKLLKRKIEKEFIVISITLAGMIIVLRYTRTPLFPSYAVFMHPYILLFTAWTVYELWKKMYISGICICFIIMVMSLVSDVNEIQGKTNKTYTRIQNWKANIYNEFPGKDFALYDFNYDTVTFSVPLSLVMEVEHRLNDDGVKIGIGTNPQFALPVWKKFTLEQGYLPGRNLDSSTSAELKNTRFKFVNPSEIYHQTEEWR